MTDRPKDALLVFGKVVALILQGLCVLAGGLFALLVPAVVLLNLGMLPGLGDVGDTVATKHPLGTVGIALLITANLAAMFSFFGKMRALIESAGKGDPFIPENAHRLNAMAWLLLGALVLAVMVGEVRAHLAGLMDPQGDNAIDYGPTDLAGLLIVLVLFILARVFRQGAAMRADLEGTV